MFEQLIATYGASEIVMKALCHSTRDFISTVTTAMRPLFPRVLARMVASFKVTLFPCTLYVVESLIKVFSEEVKDSEAHQLIYGGVTDLSQSACAALATTQDFITHPDLVKHFFWVILQLILSYPRALLQNPTQILLPIMRYSLIGLQLEEREGSKAVLRCYESTFIAARKEGLVKELEQALDQQGLAVQLMSGLLLAAGVWQPVRQIPILCDTFYAFRAMDQQAFSHLVEIVLMHPSTPAPILLGVPQDAREALVRGLTAQQLRESTLRHLLQDFHDACKKITIPHP